MEDKNANVIKKDNLQHNYMSSEESKHQLLKQQMIFDRQQRDIQVTNSLDLIYVILPLGNSLSIHRIFMFLQELKNTIYTTKAGMQFMQMKFHEEFHNLGRVHKIRICFT